MPDIDDLEELFDVHLDVGLHHGAQLAVYHEGDLVADFAGGVTSEGGPETTSKQRHLLFSCTKPLAGACLHHLVDQGKLDYDDRVREHWPAFAAPGTAKADVTVRHVLSHQAGLPQSAFDARPDLWSDWDAVVTAMEDTECSFEPGTTAAYHALTYGWLVGELVRRVSGTPIDEYATEHVFDPLGMTQTSIGYAGDDVATLYGFEPFDRCRDPAFGLGTLTNVEAAAVFNDPGVRGAVVPAATGVSTARDVARFYACMAAGGELDGTRLLSEERVQAATEVQVEVERDGTLGVPRRYALGFERAGTAHDKYGALAPARVFGHGGLGSIVTWADPRAELAVAYLTNGIRDEYEHVARTNVMADAIRRVFT